MPRIPVHTVENAPTASRETLATLASRMGKVLNIHAEMAHSPVVLATYAAMQQAIAEHGTFDPATREAIALTVGAVDQCDYCQAAHTASARRAGLGLEQTIAIRRGAVDFDDRLAALLSLTTEITNGVGHVEEATFTAALEAGWTSEQLAELFAHVAANLYTNYFNHYAETEVDVPAAPPLVS